MNDRPGAGNVRPLYRFVQFTTLTIYRVLFGLTCEGLEHVPDSGPFIVAPNHASLLDPPAVGCLIPREVSFFAKKELMSIPVVGWFLRYARTIPVDRAGYSGGSLKRIFAALKSGRGVIMFPEGTRSRTGEFLEPKSGVGMVAVKSEVPVVPCWIEGSFDPKPFRTRITLHFMPPFMPSEVDAPSKKEQYSLVSEHIMHYIIKLSES